MTLPILNSNPVHHRVVHRGNVVQYRQERTRPRVRPACGIQVDVLRKHKTKGRCSSSIALLFYGESMYQAKLGTTSVAGQLVRLNLFKPGNGAAGGKV